LLTLIKQSDEASVELPDWGDNIDGPTFEQILEMDDDDDKDFSKSIVFDFFVQAQNTFEKMDDSL
jgi:osomolarity two-component system, phosphorelay intermediate protein YPD1